MAGIGVVVPAYNVEHVIERTLDALPPDPGRIVVVDDGSADDTAARAEAWGAEVIRHEGNRGYGAAQKTGFGALLDDESIDVAVLVHGDNQYDPSLVPRFAERVRDGFPAVTGTRMLDQDPRESGMPGWRYLANRGFTRFQNLMFGTTLTDFHDGYRAYAMSFLREIDLGRLSDAFDFDVQTIAEAVRRGHPVGEVPHPVRYTDENSSISFTDSIRCGLAIIRIALRYRLGRST